MRAKEEEEREPEDKLRKRRESVAVYRSKTERVRQVKMRAARRTSIEISGDITAEEEEEEEELSR